MSPDSALFNAIAWCTERWVLAPTWGKICYVLLAVLTVWFLVSLATAKRSEYYE